MGDGNGMAEVLLGLDGFRVLAVTETVEVVIEIETAADFVGCATCGVRAEPHERMDVEVGIWPASVDRSVWCGACGGGVAWSRTVTLARGPRSRLRCRAVTC